LSKTRKTSFWSHVDKLNGISKWFDSEMNPNLTASLATSFASDNYAGVHPQVMQAIIEANVGHTPAYGQDPWTEQAQALIAKHFGPQARAFFVFNGTGGNVLALKAITQGFNAIICSDVAHINVDECGAPEHYTGCKLITLPSDHGQLTPEGLSAFLATLSTDVHHVQPKVLSLTQPTELGTVYPLPTFRTLCQLAHDHGLLVHVDGARLANAAAFLGVDLHTLTQGADMVTFGGTKNGLMGGEAIVCLNPALMDTVGLSLPYIRKQGMQLASKMRFISAQFVALLENDLWQLNAQHANAMAQRLANHVLAIKGVNVLHPVQANGVFVQLPLVVITHLQQRHRFYVWDGSSCCVRWMTAFDTSPQAVDAFAQEVAQAMQLQA
jgi:threonine aldolase